MSWRNLILASLLLASSASAQDGERRRSSVELLEGPQRSVPRGEGEPQLSPLEAAVEAPLAGGEPTDLLQDALDRLVAIELAVATKRLSDDALVRELDAVRKQVQRALVGVAAEPAVRPAEPAEPAGGASRQGVLTDEEADALAASIARASLTVDKLDALHRGVEARRLTVDQVERLVGLFAFSRDRVEALVYLHPRVVDPERFGRLLSSLKFESDRESVRAQLGLDG